MNLPVTAEIQTNAVSTGYFDFFGYHGVSRGWLLCGWLPLSASDQIALRNNKYDVEIKFEKGTVRGDSVLAQFSRDDLGNRGIGVIIHVVYSGAILGRMLAVNLTDKTRHWQMVAAAEAVQLRDTDLAARLRPILASAYVTAGRSDLLNLLARRGYTGESTLSSLRDKVMIEFDEVILCPPHGVFILGWCLATPRSIVSMRLCGGLDFVELDPSRFVSIERWDVIDAVGRSAGFNDPNCGFITYVENPNLDQEILHLEVETRGREVGFKNLPPAKLRGMPAMRRVLDSFDVRWTDLMPAFDNVIGPGIGALNAARMDDRARVTVLEFGRVPANPRYSILVPLYGRMEFMEYQFAFMSAHINASDFDLLYVLDDPPKRHELVSLAESIYERFKIPFRLILLDENMGFAPANNAGLEFARGEFVCFLNSDVFPETPDWMEKLCEDLERDPTLGVIGPLLLFEDGSVQHEGIFFEALPMFGNMLFPMHSRKGWRPRQNVSIERRLAITGACMVMRLELANDLQGFDESFIIGDFEDTDLCMRLHKRNLACAIDHRVQLYHLERKSQVSSGQRWRNNLTLFNAWIHQKRWGSLIENLLEAGEK